MDYFADMLAGLPEIAPPKPVKRDANSIAWEAKSWGLDIAKVRAKVCVDLDYEYTPFFFEEISLDVLHELDAGFEKAFPFPGSVELERTSPGWFVRRSHARDLSLTGTIGWFSDENGKVLCCTLSNGEKAYLARIVRDPGFRQKWPGLRPVETHRS